MSGAWVKEVQEGLRNVRQYLKSDYKLHISLENNCADHCCTYALSDSKQEFTRKCVHKHNMTCDRCDLMKCTLSTIQYAVSSEDITMR